MKNLFMFIAFMFAISTLQAQEYWINFEATGASTTITSIIVENRTQGISVTLSGNDVLHLSGTTGINPLKEKDPFCIKTSPNPMPGICNIDFQILEQGLANIELYNVSGKLVLQKAEQLAPVNHTFRLSGLNKGVYLLKLSSETKTSTSKIVSVNNNISTPVIECISIASFSGNLTQKPDSRMKKTVENNNSEVELAYSEGDHILVKAFNGLYSSYSLLDPTILPSSFAVIIRFIPCIDAEGKSYPVAEIGAQYWMAENLKTTKLIDGTSLSDEAWIIPDSAAYCNYLYTTNNDTINTYGRLYNWHAVKTNELCPIGWHVPTQDEWIALTEYLEGNSDGGKLKESGTAHWISPNTGATDLFGFSAVPGGWYSVSGIFNFMGKYGFYWSSTEAGTSNAKVWSFEYDNEYMMSDPSNRSNGFSVRCIND